MPTLRITLALTSWLWLSCSGGDGSTDAGPRDASFADAGRSDATVGRDATVRDDGAVPTDAPPTDAPALDASALDATALDATALDATAVDATALDATALDAPSTDASMPPDGASCTLPSVDPSGAGASCENPLGTPDPSLCPVGYDCTEFIGFRLGYTCERPCTTDCDCPMHTTCGDRCDKSGCFRACQAS